MSPNTVSQSREGRKHRQCQRQRQNICWWWYEYGSFAPNVDVNVLKHIWSCWHHALQQVAYVHTHLICVLCTATYSLTENQAQSQRRLVKWRWSAPFITKRKRSTRLDTISEDNGHNKYVQNCFVVDKAFFKMLRVVALHVKSCNPTSFQLCLHMHKTKKWVLTRNIFLQLHHVPVSPRMPSQVLRSTDWTAAYRI